MKPTMAREAPAPLRRGSGWRRGVAPLFAGFALVVWTGTGGENTDVAAHFTGFGAGVALGALLLVTAAAWSRAHLYGTAAVLIAAWIVRSLPEALQALDAGLEQVLPCSLKALRP